MQNSPPQKLGNEGTSTYREKLISAETPNSKRPQPELQKAVELTLKLRQIRAVLAGTEARAVRLRGTDWFAWATAGASNTVLLTAERGVAELLVTEQGAWVLTDEIEAERLRAEELPAQFELSIHPWAEPARREAFVAEATDAGKVLSDRPNPGEDRLPRALIERRLVLLPEELERYRQVGRLASEAMGEVLGVARSDWTGYQLAGPLRRHSGHAVCTRL